MYKKILLTIILFIFSIFYSKNTLNYLKSKDKIMIKIKNDAPLYKKNYIEGLKTKRTIIPGVNGKIIDIDKSYKKMKRLGYYNKDLLVFKEIKPNILLKNNLDKVIIQGNQSINKISLIFIINNINEYNSINNILSTYNIKSNYILNNKLLNNEYCITYNLSIDKNCKLQKKNTILIKNIINNYYLSNIKNNLFNGSIITLSINNNYLTTIINYIINNNYKIVPLNILLNEKDV